MCFNRPSKSYRSISINSIYESSNFFSTDLIQPAIHSGLYFTAISLTPSLKRPPSPSPSDTLSGSGWSNLSTLPPFLSVHLTASSASSFSFCIHTSAPMCISLTETEKEKKQSVSSFLAVHTSFSFF